MLCLPITWFDLSNENEEIYEAICDRYRLARKVFLTYPKPEVCYDCKRAMKHSEIRHTVHCSNREFHKSCLKERRFCPYCRVPWVGLMCIVCRQSCTPTGECLYACYPELASSRMSCCSVDVHSTCHGKVQEACPAFLTELKCGIPLPVTPQNFCKRRWSLRQTQLKRKQVAAGY